MSDVKKRSSGKVSKTSEAGSKSVPEMTPDEAHYTKLLLGFKDNIPEKGRPYFEKAAPFIAKLIMFAIWLMPFCEQAVAKIDEIIQVMPIRILRGCLGLCLCFFGGVFPLTVAAVEAWKLCGGDAAIAALKELKTEFVKYRKASQIDDEADDDGDGVADVKQISPKELATRKTKLMLKVITPEVVSVQVACLYTGWIGVVATLKVQFAKTIALGAAMGAVLYEFAERVVEPKLKALVPEEYSQWVPWVVKNGTKMLAIWMAWWVQRILSAFHSAVRGGQMAGKELVNFAQEKGWLTTKDEDTYIDEIAGVIFAVVGLCVQFALGFGIPFPLNLIAWPVYICEGVIAWSINS